MAFKKGHKLAKGGAREGSGRPSDWLREKCGEIIKKKKLIEFLGDVAAGEDVEQQINQNGEVLNVPASVKDRLKAYELLADRWAGKPTQALEVGGTLNVTNTNEIKKETFEFLQAVGLK